MSERHRTSSAAETEALAGRLAAGLEPGDLVLLTGDLGAGKTTFVRGAARALGFDGPVTSPTFTIGHRYRVGDRVIAHLDLFRLGSLAGEEPGFLDDYLTRDAIAFIEWPEVGAGDLPAPRVVVRLRHGGGDRRVIEIDLRP